MSALDAIYLLFLLISSAYTFHNFTNYTIYEITAFNARERALLYYIFSKNDLLVFMNGITNEAALPMDVIVDNCCVNFFENKLRDNDLEYTILKKDILVRNIDDMNVKSLPHPYAPLPNISHEFLTWEAIVMWVDFKLKKFPILKKIKIAKTYEQREIFLLKISTGKKNSAVFLMAGEEGRDRLSPAILLNFVEYILEQKLNVDLLTKHHDFYILPILNPDGYEYSINKRWAWSRNRKIYFPKNKCSANTSAIGINIDRNWFFSKDTIRDEECDPVFSGSKSLSEEETAGLAKFLDKIALRMLAFINVRSFERLVTIPYGYTEVHCNNYPVLLDIVTSVHDRIKEEHGRTFFYGTTAAYLYNFSGNVADWVKKKLNTPIVYTFYLTNEEYIFPGASDIVPLTNEFATMMKEVLMLASSIYSPLFASQIKLVPYIIFIITNVVTTMII